jgi:hypothetical protein
MDSSDLTLDQLETLLRRAGQDLAYLASLRVRMRQVGFPIEDELVLLVEDAQDRLQRLRMWLHNRVDEAMKRHGMVNLSWQPPIPVPTYKPPDQLNVTE